MALCSCLRLRWLCRCCCCSSRSKQTKQDNAKGALQKHGSKSRGRFVSFLLMLIALRLCLLRDHYPSNYGVIEICQLALDKQHLQPRELQKEAPPHTVAPGVRKLVSSKQSKRLKHDDAIERYNLALNMLTNNMTLIPTIDPLLPENRSMEARLPFHPKVQYLGVLVDAGRHYFELDWLKKLIRFLHQLRYNLIHLRLTDDQAFNVRLNSYPTLAKGSSWHEDRNRVYTPEELRDLVSFAKEHDITIIPEVNLPGHGGAWGGIPDLVVKCPKFICSKGYGIPLNVEHPEIKSILKGVLNEVLDIFGNPPFLHLGGDELSVASECFEEAGIEPFDYTKFEQMLQDVLKEIGYPEAQVIRWEETPQLRETYDPSLPRPSYRAGAIEHYWHDRPGFRSDDKGEIIDFAPPKQPHFVSHKLYMDTNHDSGTPDIFGSTVKNLQRGKGDSYLPTALVVGSFELDADFWMLRNVAGRLIAVAMGAAELELNHTKEVLEFYNHTCRDTLGLNPIICDLQGFTATTYQFFASKWNLMWLKFRNNICNRLTDKTKRKYWKDLKIHREEALGEGNKYMWQTMKDALSQMVTDRTVDEAPRANNPTRTGVILDLVNGMKSFNRTSQIVEKFLAPLEISMLQLRLLDNHAFAVKLEHLPSVGFSIEQTNWPVPSAADLSQLVNLTQQLGIHTFPEISVSSSAGGWAYSGFVVKCPVSYCDESGNGPIAADISREEFLPVIYSTIRELLDIFSINSKMKTERERVDRYDPSTMPYLHLGSDERRSNLQCFEESGLKKDPPYADFERNLTQIVQDMLGLNTQRIVRWENDEQLHYGDRTGEITHYRSTKPFVMPTVRPGEESFVTIDLLEQPSLFDVYKNTRALLQLKPTAIFAELRRLDEEAWEQFQVELRLSAFRMGTQLEEDDIEDKGKFLNELSAECRELDFEKCEEATSMQSLSRWLSSGKPLYFYGSKEAREDICNLYTDDHTFRIMKEEVLENGDGDDPP